MMKDTYLIVRQYIDKALEDVYWYDASVFKLYYYEGNTLTGLAKKTGISRNSLFKISSLSAI